jgi:hypothetical protein
VPTSLGKVSYHRRQEIGDVVCSPDRSHELDEHDKRDEVRHNGATFSCALNRVLVS